MQTGLQAAITAFEGLHNKLSSGIHKEKYLNYCENKDVDSMIQDAKRRLASDHKLYSENETTTRTWRYRRDGTRMNYVSQEKEFYVGIWTIEGNLSMLEVPPPKALIREIIGEKPVGEKTIDDLLKLESEYVLISFHHVYLSL